MDKEWKFTQILDYVSDYCESSEDFQYIINNIEQMKENFEEDEDDGRLDYIKPWEKY